MNNARHKSIVEGLSAIAAKVYEAVPISEPWTVHQVLFEMARLNNQPYQIRVVAGCLSNLVESGLVKEPSRGSFVREPVKERPTIEAMTKKGVLREFAGIAPKEQVMPTNQPASGAAQLIDRLAQIGSSLRALADHAKSIADEIDSAALAAEEDRSKLLGESDKLRQLQTLLKSISA